VITCGAHLPVAQPTNALRHGGTRLVHGHCYARTAMSTRRGTNLQHMGCMWATSGGE
jgi:hypothetical protein